MHMLDKLGMIGVSDPVETLNDEDLIVLSTALSLWRLGPTPMGNREHADQLQDRLRREQLRRIRSKRVEPTPVRIVYQGGNHKVECDGLYHRAVYAVGNTVQCLCFCNDAGYIERGFHIELMTKYALK